MQFLRKLRVRFSGEGGSLEVNQGGNDNNQIYITIDIERSIGSRQNTAEIEIYNLSESSRKSIGEEFTFVEVEAGYVSENVDVTGIIFAGEVRDSEVGRDDTDIITTVTAGDGDRAIRKATALQSFPAGTPKEDVVEYLFAQFEAQGIERGEWVFPEMQPFLRPYSISNSVVREMNLLGRSNGFYWSIQNNVLEIVPRAESLPQTAVLNSNTGMIGYPKITDNGIKVSALINPEVRPNRLIKVESDAVELNAENGEYRVGSIHYRGDNKTGAFLMTIHAEASIGEGINEGVQQ